MISRKRKSQEEIALEPFYCSLKKVPSKYLTLFNQVVATFIKTPNGDFGSFYDDVGRGLLLYLLKDLPNSDQLKLGNLSNYLPQQITGIVGEIDYYKMIPTVRPYMETDSIFSLIGYRSKISEKYDKSDCKKLTRFLIDYKADTDEALSNYHLTALIIDDFWPNVSATVRYNLLTAAEKFCYYFRNMTYRMSYLEFIIAMTKLDQSHFSSIIVPIFHEIYWEREKVRQVSELFPDEILDLISSYII